MDRLRHRHRHLCQPQEFGEPVRQLASSRLTIGSSIIPFCRNHQIAVQVTHGAGIPLHNVREQQSHGDAVFRSVMCAERICGGMGSSQHTIFNGGTGQECPQLHFSAGVQILGFPQHHRKCGRQMFPCLSREHLRDRVAFCRDVTFNRVRHRINSRGRGDGRRHSHGEFRVQDGDPARCLGITTGHFHMRFRIRDDSERLCFAPCPGCRGYRDHRKHSQRRFANSFVVLHPAAVGQEEVGTFGTIDAAAASEPHDQPNIFRPRKCNAAIDVVCGWVFLHLIKNCNLKSCCAQMLLSLIAVTGFPQPDVGHDEHSSAT